LNTWRAIGGGDPAAVRRGAIAARALAAEPALV
jgi:hypothetical protein